jgi:hypothetical protein
MAGNFSGGSFSGAVGGFSVDSGAPAVVVAETFSGGFLDYAAPRRRTSDDLRLERERFGISLKAQGVISAVAEQQAARLELDSHKRFEELERELQAQQIAWRAEYLTALNSERERLITAEIRARLQAMQRDDEAVILALLASVL